MKFNIVGKEWEDCYLNDFESSAGRRKQVLKDLNEKCQGPVKIDDLITIDLEDHSTGFEQFIVTGIFSKSKIVKLEYYGGGS